MDEIPLNESKNVSAVNDEEPEFLESNYDANNMYQVERMSLEDTKEN